MLNIYNLKLNNKNKDKVISLHKKGKGKDPDQGEQLGLITHYPPANKEWFNSIYAYNKNTLKSLPVADKVVIKLIKSYFNFYSRKLEGKIKSKRLRTRIRRLSTNRIFVSRAEFKHTNSKVTVTLYIYNRQKKYFFNKIRRLNTITGLRKKSFIRKIRLIKLQGLAIIKKVQKVQKEKNLFFETPIYDSVNFKNYAKQYYKNFIVKSLQKEMLNIHYKRIVYFNRSKFENTRLFGLTNILKKVYNKHVEFNLVNLKYLHLNSDILSESIAIKLKKRKNRLLRVLKASMRMIKYRPLNKLTILDDTSSKANKTWFLKKVQNLKVNSFLSYVGKKKDALDKLLQKIFPSYTNDKPFNFLVNTVLNSIKNKSINGVRVEAAGRLSRRFTAAKSVFKFKYIGNLKNLDTSYKGLSSVLLRGHVKSNLQFTKIKSKTRIGSFGLKGWISSR